MSEHSYPFRLDHLSSKTIELDVEETTQYAVERNKTKCNIPQNAQKIIFNNTPTPSPRDVPIEEINGWWNKEQQEGEQKTKDELANIFDIPQPNNFELVSLIDDHCDEFEPKSKKRKTQFTQPKMPPLLQVNPTQFPILQTQNSDQIRLLMELLKSQEKQTREIQELKKMIGNLTNQLLNKKL